MASSFFRQFAIENELTVDYGYMYGKYKNFYISVKESIGSSKILTVITRLSENKEMLKKVLSVYGEELPKYCINDMQMKENYLQFTFNLPNDEASLVIEFLNLFIQSYIDNGNVVETLCPFCNKPLLDSEKITWIDFHGILTPAHDECYDKGINKIKEEVVKKDKEINKDRKNYFVGFLGSFVFAIIYMLIIVAVFFFIQFLLNNMSSGDQIPFEDATMSARIFQYAPVLACLSASPLIYAGYETFKGKKGNGKFLIILFTAIITTIIGIFIGFVLSLTLVASGYSLGELFSLVFKLLKPTEGYQSFRRAFYIYIILGVVLSIVSLAFNFNNKKAMEEANAVTIEKLK